MNQRAIFGSLLSFCSGTNASGPETVAGTNASGTVAVTTSSWPDPHSGTFHRSGGEGDHRNSNSLRGPAYQIFPPGKKKAESVVQNHEKTRRKQRLCRPPVRLLIGFGFFSQNRKFSYWVYPFLGAVPCFVVFAPFIFQTLMFWESTVTVK